MVEFGLHTNKYYFGKDSIQGLENILKDNFCKKILLVYGGGSIKKNGIYDEVINICTNMNVKIIEHDGVQPNPIVSHTNEGGKKAFKHKVDLILAVGGGSVIDAAKIMAALGSNPQIKSSWDIVETNSENIKYKPIKVVSIITLAGTASENNNGSVLTNDKTKEKKGTKSIGPIATIANPEYTFSVSKYQTASGIFDIFSHLLEQYFIQEDGDEFEWTDQYIFSNIRVILKFARTCLFEPNNYTARANILWTSSFALNGLASFSYKSSDWKIHRIEHGISGYYDVAHGAGLALITPYYLKYVAKYNDIYKVRIKKLGQEVFNTNTVEKTIEKIEIFIRETLNLPRKWSDFEVCKNISKKDISNMTKLIYLEDKEFVKNILLEIPF